MQVHRCPQLMSKAAQFLQSQGVTRVVPAREPISLEEIQEIYRATGMEIECFVHGALCYCYSGQCLLQQPDRRTEWKQRAVCPAVPSPLQCGSEQQKEYVLSPKDICTLDLIPELSRRASIHLRLREE